jgi:hypothetical protein
VFAAIERGLHGFNGSSRIKPKKISANPLYLRHPRFINPYIDLKTALESENR